MIKRLPAAIAVVVALLPVAGCMSVSDLTGSVREKFSTADPAQTRVFAANQRTTYDAVRSAAQQLGYRIVRGGAAQGELDAVSGVGPGERTGSSRQLAMKVRLRGTEEDTHVTVRFTEIIEADSSNRAGQATETPLRDTPQYQVFFRLVEQALVGTPRGAI
jgi:hypothetical protein